MSSYEKEFKESKALTSFIGALIIAFTLLSGPFAGGLLNRYNARMVVIAGAFIGSAGFAVATLSPNIFFYLIFYGVVGGIGFGLIYLPGIVAVSQYFESKRALATGIAVAGSGFGTFLMPVINKTVIESKFLIYIQSLISLFRLWLASRDLRQCSIHSSLCNFRSFLQASRRSARRSTEAEFEAETAKTFGALQSI
jgi:MFS family permease